MVHSICSQAVSQGKSFSITYHVLKMPSTSPDSFSMFTSTPQYKIFSCILLSTCSKGEAVRPCGLEQLYYLDLENKYLEINISKFLIFVE